MLLLPVRRKLNIILDLVWKCNVYVIYSNFFSQN